MRRKWLLPAALVALGTAVVVWLGVQDARQAAALDQKATNYRRAISACLEGRGYTVK